MTMTTTLMTCCDAIWIEIMTSPASTLTTTVVSALLLSSLLALAFGAGCSGTLEVSRCDDGDVDGDLVCDDGEWVEAAQSCDDVDCGPGGVCEDGDGEVQCQCDDGFEADGLECVSTTTCQGDDCTAYVLANDSTAYERTDFLSTDLGDELTEPVIASFNLEDTHRAYLLTDSSFLRIDTEDFSVLATGSLSEIHPDIATGPSLQAAYALPERISDDVDVGQGNDVVTFLRNPDTGSRGQALLLAYDFDSASFDEGDVYEGWVHFDWSQDNPDYEGNVPTVDVDYRAMWFDDENWRGPSDIDFQQACPNHDPPPAEAPIPYTGVLTTEPLVHYQATAACFPFTEPDLAIFDDFDAAPDPDDVGAAFSHAGALYVFGSGFYQD